MTGRVSGKRALITGAASGIGAAAARLLAAEGARVALSDIDLDGARAVADGIGDAAIAIAHDVTDAESWQAALAVTEAAFGGLDILVNSAGIALVGTVEETSLEDWRRVHAVDLDSVFLGCKYAVPLMARSVVKHGGGGSAGGSAGGSIVNMSSVSGIIAGHNLAAYNSAKAGVRHLSKSVALHCARKRYGIRCNSVHPAFVDTAMLDDIVRPGMSREDGVARLAAQVPLGRVGTTADIGWAILYLASDESAFMTGAEMVLDGGASAQ
jgi:NAD(P)-dependent dehydrogenase (short-subunit alcohol dehydrogenase family)